MCRRNQLQGFIAIAFGLGMLIGKCFASGFLCNFFAIGLILVGFWILRRK